MKKFSQILNIFLILRVLKCSLDNESNHSDSAIILESEDHGQVNSKFHNICLMFKSNELKINKLIKKKKMLKIIKNQQIGLYYKKMKRKLKNLGNLICNDMGKFKDLGNVSEKKKVLNNILQNYIKFDDTDNLIRIFLKSPNTIIIEDYLPLKRFNLKAVTWRISKGADISKEGFKLVRIKLQEILVKKRKKLKEVNANMKARLPNPDPIFFDEFFNIVKNTEKILDDLEKLVQVDYNDKISEFLNFFSCLRTIDKDINQMSKNLKSQQKISINSAKKAFSKFKTFLWKIDDVFLEMCQFLKKKNRMDLHSNLESCYDEIEKRTKIMTDKVYKEKYEKITRMSILDEKHFIFIEKNELNEILNLLEETERFLINELKDPNITEIVNLEFFREFKVKKDILNIAL